MNDFWKDVKHAIHLFIKSPAFTIAAVSALALGIGANTAIFTVVNAVLLKPLTYPDADRIVEIELSGPRGNAPVASIPKFHVYLQQTSIFKEVAAYDFAGPGFTSASPTSASSEPRLCWVEPLRSRKTCPTAAKSLC